jgi:hypothetical protein
MKTKKWLLAVFMLTGMVLFAQTEADFEVTLTGDNTGVVITKYIGNVATVKIPAKIQGMPVREIGKTAFYSNSIITSVVIPEGVIVINDANNPYEGGAFSRCEKLVNVNFPSSLTKIGGFAFGGCPALRSIAIPEGVTEIGQNAFASCRSLSSVTLPKTLTKLGQWAFGNADGIFGRNNNLIFTSITLPENLKVIEEGTFYGCKNLTSIIIPEGITEICDQAFVSCVALTSVTLPSTIAIIGEYAFGGCSALAAVNIPESVEEIFFGSIFLPERENIKTRATETFSGCGKLNLASQAALKKRGYNGKF